MNTKHKLALAAILTLALAILVLVLASTVQDAGKTRLQGEGWKTSEPWIVGGEDFGHSRSMKSPIGSALVAGAVFGTAVR